MRGRELSLGGAVDAGISRVSEGPPAHNRPRTRLIAGLRRHSFQGSLAPAAQTYGAGNRGVFLLWVDLVAVPELDSAILPAQSKPRSQAVRPVRLRRILRRRARRYSGRRGHRQDTKSERRFAAGPQLHGVRLHAFILAVADSAGVRPQSRTFRDIS